MKIYINPGHSVDGTDHGACCFGLREADIALAIGRRVESYLRAVGYQVKLGQFDQLQTICDDANYWLADFFVSIHCNAVDNPAAHGTESFYVSSPDGENLARAIQHQIIKTLGTTDRHVERRNHFVTSYTNMPAVLVETAFLSNPADAKLLVDREDDFARAVARGITDFCATLVPKPKPLPDVLDLPESSSTKLSEHFDASEFVCHCCGRGAEKISPRLIELLEQLRANIGGLPLHINSGYRCPKHNAEVGGVVNSQHVLGTAADVAVPSALNIEQFKWYITQLPFDWAGVYCKDYFIHVDVRNGGDDKPCQVDYMN